MVRLGKYKVIHVLNTGGYSGAENVVITSMHAMKDSVEAVYVSPKGSITNILKANGLEHYPLDTEYITRESLKKAIKEIQPDIIHTHDFRTGMVAASINTKIPIINHLHKNSPFMRTVNIKSVLYGISTFRYRNILTVSDSIISEFVFRNMVKNKAQVIGNPLDIERIKEKESVALKNDTSDILYLGRLSEEKNPIKFLDIINALHQKKADIKVAMVGAGEMKDLVNEYIRKNNLEDVITTYGFVSNPYGLVGQTKVLCMPSVWEGYGMAAVEAMALGKPVVAQPVGGLVKIVDDKCGKLCDSVEEYVEAIKELLEDNELYGEKSRMSLLKARAISDLSEYKHKVLEIYERAIEG